MTAARISYHFSLVLLLGLIVMPQPGFAQALGGTPSRAAAGNYSPRQSARAHAPRSSYRRQPGFLERLFGSAPRRAGPRAGYDPYGWNSYGSSYSGRGYRTLCVRLCDGYYWPLSFSTASRGIRVDAARCENSCSAPTRLFYERSPGGNAQYMIDIKGKRYSGLENAFRYRKEYVENCRCKPEPWSAEARAEYDARDDEELTTASIEESEVAAKTAMPAQKTARSRSTVQRASRRRPRAVRRQVQRRSRVYRAWR